jgi:hypothetical protein
LPAPRQPALDRSVHARSLKFAHKYSPSPDQFHATLVPFRPAFAVPTASNRPIE